MEGLQDKVAIVTGSSGGIGMGIALKLAECGTKVVINGRTAETGEAVAKRIRDRGGEARFIPGDVRARAHMEHLVGETLRAYGRIDAMVASSGGWAVGEDRPRGKFFGPFADLDIGEAAEFVRVATLAKLMPVHAVVPHMIARNGGSILFVTSEGGRFPTPGQTAIATSAAGLIMATKVIAKELSRHRIRVNCIAVTVVEETPTWDWLNGRGAPADDRQRRYARVRERAPFGLAKPHDIGSIAAFHVSDGAQFITGTTVSPTGGLTYS
jgi:2-hydroxycyclohexanecarboxyl-CoA dehydrogenase